MPAPTTAIDATFDDGFALNSGLHIAGAGVLLVAGDAFKWRPWIREGRKEGTVEEGAVGNDVEGGRKGGVAGGVGKLRGERGMWECDKSAWGALEVVWPKPGDLWGSGLVFRIYADAVHRFAYHWDWWVGCACVADDEEAYQ